MSSIVRPLPVAGHDAVDRVVANAYELTSAESLAAVVEAARRADTTSSSASGRGSRD